MQRKLWFVFGVFCVLFVILIARLMYIEYSSGKKYEKIVLSQQEYDSEIIPFQRGDIEDSKGTVLATSVDVYNVILDAKVLNANEDCIDSTFSALSEYIPEADTQKGRSVLSDDPDNQYTVLAKKISYEEMEAFEQAADAEDSNIKGIWFEKTYQRVYPYGSLGAALIGFATSGNTGVIGLENQYNSILNGVNGRSYGYLNSDSSLEQTVIDAENGKTLVTSIDVNIQSIVEQAISDFNAQYANENGDGSKNTAVLVMNPQTGEILAMATYPTFDLNNPRDLTAFFDQSEIDAMSADDQLNFLNNLWQNYPVSHTYEPGSTFKPFTVACGLDTGTLTGDETYFCDGGEVIGDYTVHCVNRSGHGLLTVQQALMESCNDALMQMSYAIGAHNFAEYQNLFGFGQKTNIDLPGEARTDSLIYTEEQLGQTINLATNAFGQNFNTTMVQLASAFCSLINGGTLYQPHVVTKIVDSSGNTVREIEPLVLKQTVSKEVSDQMKTYLRAVVAEGTGKTAGVDGYDVGGKTGTAQKLPRSEGNYLVSFIGYAPQDTPEVLIYTIVDEPNTADQAHSSYAQEITHNILAQILPYLNIETSAQAAAAQQ